MRDIRKAAVVRSLAGHDRGSVFYVLDLDGRRALIADGRTRPIDNPKHKNVRHLKFLGLDKGIAAKKLNSGEIPTNKEMIRGLAEFMSAYSEETEVS